MHVIGSKMRRYMKETLQRHPMCWNNCVGCFLYAYVLFRESIKFIWKLTAVCQNQRFDIGSWVGIFSLKCERVNQPVISCKCVKSSLRIQHNKCFVWPRVSIKLVDKDYFLNKIKKVYTKNIFLQPVPWKYQTLQIVRRSPHRRHLVKSNRTSVRVNILG